MTHSTLCRQSFVFAGSPAGPKIRPKRYWLAFIIIGCLTGLSAFVTPIYAQTETELPVAETDKSMVSIDGIVVDQQKYSITVRTADKDYQVKLAANATVGLRMNRPFFDWEAGKVFVEALAADQDPATAGLEPEADKSKVEKVGFILPNKQLFLIAKFRNLAHLKRVMKGKEKRMNFYLLSPEDLGQHEPTEDELFVAGKLTTGKNNAPITLQTDQQKHRVRLGFRFATMNGFSIAELKKNQTRVTLSGTLDETTGSLIASSVAFHPLKKN